MPPRTSGYEERVVNSTCCSHCHGTCLLKVHIQGGHIRRIETDGGEEPQNRACPNGRAYRQRVYAPERLVFPMKRVGPRGEGKFERTTWDEALDIVARELRRVRGSYGSASILFKWSGGDLARLHGGFTHRRLLCMTGGCSDVWGSASNEAAAFESIANFGTAATSSTRDSLLASRLILMWGWNPSDTHSWTNTAWYVLRAKEAGAKVIAVDPRFTDSAAAFADQWIPIIPGTDAAMIIAMAYVVFEEQLLDTAFIETYTIGFEQFKDYLIGREDGVAKTPRWAETITGVSAETIAGLARNYATLRPGAIMSGLAPGRTAFGEQYHRAAATLAAMAGNIGIVGGDAGASGCTGIFAGSYPFLKLGQGLPVPPNPVEAQRPARKNDFPSWNDYWSGRPGFVHHTKMADAILRGKAGGYPADYKLLYLVNTHFPNQYPNINRCVEALKCEGLEFIVIFEQSMNAGAKFADILLPVNTFLERNDITIGPTVGFVGFMGKAIDSLGESRSHMEICQALAAKMGIVDFANGTEDEYLRAIAAINPEITDYQAFKTAGGHKVRREKPHVAFQQEIERPSDNPFATPSGKIEIYCQRIADMNDPLLPPIPKYIETWESRNDPLAARYPLQLITTRIGRRVLSQNDKIPWLLELEPQALTISRRDAYARGITNDDEVRVFNDRGEVLTIAKVTERIMPGVVNLPQGAWYDPDRQGLDLGGCPNVLTKDEHSPGGAFPTNTALVQVERIKRGDKKSVEANWNG